MKIKYTGTDRRMPPNEASDCKSWSLIGMTTMANEMNDNSRGITKKTLNGRFSFLYVALMMRRLMKESV